MTDVTLREFVELAIARERDARDLQFSASEKALREARATIEHRLQGMNELREQINRERGNFVNREVFDQRFGDFEARMRSLENSRSNLDGRIWMLGGFFAIIQIVIAAVMLVLKK